MLLRKESVLRFFSVTFDDTYPVPLIKKTRLNLGLSRLKLECTDKTSVIFSGFRIVSLCELHGYERQLPGEFLL